MLLFSRCIQFINWFLALMMIRNVSRAAYQHIRMISGGSWENSALITGLNYILKRPILKQTTCFAVLNGTVPLN